MEYHSPEEAKPMLDCVATSGNSASRLPRVLAYVFVAGAVVAGLTCMMMEPETTRRLSPRTTCAAQVRGIAQACLIYAESHDGVLPPDLDVLLEGGERAYIGPKMLICPVSGQPYSYIGGQTTDHCPLNVVVFELPHHHNGEGGNVAFLDGHARWYPAAKLQDELAATATRLARQAYYASATSRPQMMPAEAKGDKSN